MKKQQEAERKKAAPVPGIIAGDESSAAGGAAAGAGAGAGAGLKKGGDNIFGNFHAAQKASAGDVVNEFKLKLQRRNAIGV